MSGPVAGAYAEHDPRVAASITGSPNITALADLTGNGHHLDFPQGTPKTGTRTINGFNAIKYGGLATDAVLNVAASIPPPYTVFAVVQADVLSATGFFYATNVGQQNFGQTGTQWTGGTAMAGGTVDLNPHVICFQVNGASSFIRVDGVEVASGSAGASTPTLFGFGGDGGTAFNGLVGHDFVFASALSISDVILEEQFLGSDWQIFPVAPITGINPSFWGPQGFELRRDLPFQMRGAESAAAPITTPQSLDVTSTATASITDLISYARTLSVTSTASATLTRVNSFLRTLSVTSTAAATLTRVNSFLRSLSPTSTGTATMTRSVQKPLAVTSTQTPTMTRAASKTLSATSTGTATLARVVSYARTLAAVSTGTATIGRIVSYLRTLSATSTATATMSRIVSKTLAAISTSTPVLLAGSLFLRTLSATSTAVATLTKTAVYTRTLSVVSTGTVSLVRTIGKILSVTSSGLPELFPIKTGGTVTPQAMSATVTQTAELLVELVPAAGGGMLRPGRTFAEERGPRRRRLRLEEIEKVNQDALALMLLNQ